VQARNFFAIIRAPWDKEDLLLLTLLAAVCKRSGESLLLSNFA